MGVLLCTTNVKAQRSIHVSGTIVDQESQNKVVGASIRVAPLTGTDSTTIGTSSDLLGKFEFSFNYKVPFKLVVNHVSYYTQEITIRSVSTSNLKIELDSRVVESEDIVVTASIISEEELESPITVDRISTVDVKQLASYDVFDLISTLREVDVATQSMTMQSINTRGFNASANKRFLQLTDGVDNQAPGLSFPIGNLMGAPGVDIASVEVIPGPSSAKYGSSALNGTLLTKTLDPFSKEGVTLQIKGGANEVAWGGNDFFSFSANGTYDISGRIAKAFGDKLAVKITGNILGGTDWKAENYENIGFGEPGQSRLKEDKMVRTSPLPGYNGVNIYGDENFAYLPVGSGQLDTKAGALYPVSRSGYKESSLVDYDIATRKLAGAIHYKFSPDYRLIAEGRYGFTNALYTGDSRVRLDGFEMYQGKLDLKFKNFSFLGYSTWQNSGHSFDVNRLANNLIRSAKSDENWFRDYQMIYNRGLPFLGIPARDYNAAREFADSGSTLLEGETASSRYVPGTERFDKKVNEIKYNTDFQNGAAIRDNSGLYHLQSSYKVDDWLTDTDLEFGGNFRFYDINSGGTVFPDTLSNDIKNYEFGGFVQVKSRLYDKVNIHSALRIDKNENFAVRISPTVAVNYSMDKKNYFRFSYQNGFRYPGLREQFINKDLGKARLVGGLPGVVHQYNLPENAITTQAIDKFNQAVIRDINVSYQYPQEYNRAQAELKNLSILEEGIVGKGAFNKIKSETVNTLELGYRRLFTQKLYLDANYYLSFYNNFIGIMRVVKPHTSPSVDLFTAAGQINNAPEHEKFFVYSNAHERLMVHGISFNLEYLSGSFMTGLNGTWTAMLKDSDDPIVPGFNTPPLKLNFEWGYRNITENFSFKMVYKLRSEHKWRSPFVDGTIDGIEHIDLQFNFDIPSVGGNIKLGVSNLGVNKYYNIYGGPSVGSIFFASFTFDPNLF